MFWNWFRRRRGSAPRKRELYCYWDGQRKRWADPLELWRRFAVHPEFAEDMKLAEVLDDPPPDLPKQLADEAEAAYQRVLDTVCFVFDVDRFDGYRMTGLTMDELSTLLIEYSGYMNLLKKKRDNSQSPLPRTDSSGRSASARSTTQPSWDST